MNIINFSRSEKTDFKITYILLLLRFTHFICMSVLPNSCLVSTELIGGCWIPWNRVIDGCEPHQHESGGNQNQCNALRHSTKSPEVENLVPELILVKKD